MSVRPMSSPQMTTMFGFLACALAASEKSTANSAVNRVSKTLGCEGPVAIARRFMAAPFERCIGLVMRNGGARGLLADRAEGESSEARCIVEEFEVGFAL